MKFLAFALFSTVVAQRAPTLDDVEQIAANEVREARAYLAAAQAAGLTRGNLLARVKDANAKELSALGAGSAAIARANCVRDFATGQCVSFLKKPSLSAIIRPFAQRQLGGAESGSEYDRKTVSPFVWISLHRVGAPGVGSGHSFADYVR